MDVLEVATLLFCCLYLVTGRFIGYVVFIKLMSVNERKWVLSLLYIVYYLWVFIRIKIIKVVNATVCARLNTRVTPYLLQCLAGRRYGCWCPPWYAGALPSHSSVYTTSRQTTSTPSSGTEAFMSSTGSCPRSDQLPRPSLCLVWKSMWVLTFPCALYSYYLLWECHKSSKQQFVLPNVRCN